MKLVMMSGPLRIAGVMLCAAVLMPCAAPRAWAQGLPAGGNLVWIDTDPAMGEPDRDVDDGIALIQAFRSPEIVIRAVSVVFGNTSLERGLPIARELTGRFGPKGVRVWGGAASAADLGRETDASRALAAALERERLTVLVLGPATNVATVLKNHPRLASRIIRIIAIAGRRPNQRFTTGTVNTKGHRDFNFELDPDAFDILLRSRVPLVLHPFEISSKIWIGASDLDQLAGGPEAAKAIAVPARAWLKLWQKLFAVDGFNPFDTLAIGYAISPAGFACEDFPIAIEVRPDDVTEPGMQGNAPSKKPFLVVSLTAKSRDLDHRALYCSTAPDGFKADLFRRLLR